MSSTNKDGFIIQIFYENYEEELIRSVNVAFIVGVVCENRCILHLDK